MPAETDFDFSLISRAAVTQQEFATFMDVSRPTVNLWVHGRKVPSKDNAHKLQAAAPLITEWLKTGIFMGLKGKQERADLIGAYRKQLQVLL